MTPSSLKLESLPLDGIHLIEASAGTGKTYTLTGLYLRQLLEAERSVAQILVVTYTKAATAELSARIRARLIEARAVFCGETQPTDPLLLNLTRRFQDRKPEMIRRLDDALTCMDEAAIFTIHSFCQRAVTDYAFETANHFKQELVTDENSLRLAIITDFWRRRFAQCDRRLAWWVTKRWLGGPADLLKAVTSYLNYPGLQMLPVISDTEATIAEADFSALAEEVKTQWQQHGEEVMALLLTDPGLKRDEKTYRTDKLQAAAQVMQQFCADPQPSLSLFSALALFTPNKLQGSLKKNAQPPEHVFFSVMARCQQVADRLDLCWQVITINAALAWLREELAQRKAGAGLLGYDDMLSRLDEALDPDQRGVVAANQLAIALAARYPVAMVDEFQDTDQRQYRIFQRIYKMGVTSLAEHSGRALYLVGDPKQAIYQFRGADVYTYVRARRDIAGYGAPHTLGVNQRSVGGLVTLINAIFEHRPDAFLMAPEIDFHPVAAAGRAESTPFEIDGQPVTPLQLTYLLVPDEPAESVELTKPAKSASKAKTNKTVGIDKAKALISVSYARQIQHLLALAAAGRARLGDRPLRAGDIAVLVRNRYEAEEMRLALWACGVASVFLSKDSVFATDEAEDLSRLLWAVCEPANDGALRAAMVGHLVGMDAASLYAEVEQGGHWDERRARFQSYHELWRHRGVLPMLHALLHGEQVVGRLRAHPDGDRRLTNLLHLGELLQLASADHPGMEQQLRWLKARRDDAGVESENQQLRLESDESLIQIVTLHKSKGLEYPVVFLPYLWHGKPLKGEAVLFHDPQTLALTLDLGSADYLQHQQQAQQEHLAEELRLLYVALTRASHACYLAWGNINGTADSALAYLLGLNIKSENGKSTADNQAWLAPWQQWQSQWPGSLALQELTEADLADPIQPSPPAEAQAAAPRRAVQVRHFEGRIDSHWRVTSYTELAAASQRSSSMGLAGGDHDSRDVDADEPTLPGTGTPAVTRLVAVDALNVHSFPAGAAVGNLLHSLLEVVDFPTATPTVLTAMVVPALTHAGIEAHWQPVLVQWLTDVLDTPLDAGGSLRLRDLSAHQRRSEMAFYFPLAGLQARDLQATIRRYRPNTAAFVFSQVQGMMKGYIDLTFRHAGKYYIADYKSNRLGAADTYQHADLDIAMQAHRYDLQALIYSVALHRHLKARLPDYAYERDFGGVYYLFLRGMSPATGHQSGIHFDKPEPGLIADLDALFSGGDRA